MKHWKSKFQAVADSGSQAETVCAFQLAEGPRGRAVLTVAPLDKQQSMAEHGATRKAAQEIVDLLQQVGGSATTFEIATRTGWPELTQSGAFQKLLESNIVASDIVKGGEAVVHFTSYTKRMLAQFRSSASAGGE